jgi:hypothetical protein
MCDCDMLLLLLCVLWGCCCCPALRMPVAALSVESGAGRNGAEGGGSAGMERTHKETTHVSPCLSQPPTRAPPPPPPKLELKGRLLGGSWWLRLTAATPLREREEGAATSATAQTSRPLPSASLLHSFGSALVGFALCAAACPSLWARPAGSPLSPSTAAARISWFCAARTEGEDDLAAPPRSTAQQSTCEPVCAAAS